MARQTRVLVTEPCAAMRRAIVAALSADRQLVVIGDAPDAYAARDLIVEARPDVMTLGLRLPRLGGVAFLRKLMPRLPLPVVVYTDADAALASAARSAGAVDVVRKPGPGRPPVVALAELCTKVKIAAAADVSDWKTATAAPLGDPRSVIAIGASTGGTDALEVVLSGLLPGLPPVVIVQHMPQGFFTRLFAQRLHARCPLVVQEARDGMVIRSGTAVVAPGGHHLTVRSYAQGYKIRLVEGGLVSGHRPSVDVMMRSVADEAGPFAIGVLLTGMGRDGARGLLAMRGVGARTVAQDAASCVVYGMPRAAVSLGAAEQQLPLEDIAGALVSLVADRPSSAHGAG